MEPRRSDWPKESWRIGTTVYGKDLHQHKYEQFGMVHGSFGDEGWCRKGVWQVVENILVHREQGLAGEQFSTEEALDAFLQNFDETTRLKLRDQF